ncbi:hypothetical protein [Tranquillimonas rosea]|uniref:hypothetical protein n=1 Tax=Tranquillimonas rosea TaxID=641238 RepID=UPI003BAD9DC7
MTARTAIRPRLAPFTVITGAYVLCHGLVALLVTPLQTRLLGDVTAFASLLYLPHGVRVLATWYWGWLAALPLCLGAFLAELLFSSTPIGTITHPVLLGSILMGAVSAPLTFELFRRFNTPLGRHGSRQVRWTGLIAAGAVSSVINSVGQTLIFGGLILSEQFLSVLVLYALGDLLGLVVCMVFMMLVFRHLRTRGI